jgi:hypothetical protein
MKLKELSKPLDIEDIDFRIQSINNGKYATILAYKDARVDMRRLDEVCKPHCWQRDHKEVHGVVYCGIGIAIELVRDNKVHIEWTWKWDAGTESFTEKQKGEASDSFKRAGFNWGIGRELYDYPVISIKLNDDEVQETGKTKPKYQASWNLKLRDWIWYKETDDTGKLTYLGCKDTKGKLRFEYGTRRVG